MLTDAELIEQYKANGGTVTVVPYVEQVPTAFTGREVSSESTTYDNQGERIYKYLSRSIGATIDETMLNYG